MPLKKISEKTKSLIKSAGIRAIRTMAQTAIALIGTNAVGVTDVDWLGVLSGTALSGILSVLMSISTGLPEVDKEAIPETTEE